MVFIGALAGILVSGGTAVLSYMHRVPEYSFMSNFFYYLLKEYVLPLVLVYALYFFCTKDDYEFRVKAFFPVMASFFAIYMPYCTIASTTAAFSFYLLFVKPVVVLSMIFLCSDIAYQIYTGAVEGSKKKIILNSVAALVVLAVPVLLETMWLMVMLLPVVYIAAVLYGMIALVLFFIESRQGARFLF